MGLPRVGSWISGPPRDGVVRVRAGTVLTLYPTVLAGGKGSFTKWECTGIPASDELLQEIDNAMQAETEYRLKKDKER